MYNNTASIIPILAQPVQNQGFRHKILSFWVHSTLFLNNAVYLFKKDLQMWAHSWVIFMAPIYNTTQLSKEKAQTEE